MDVSRSRFGATGRSGDAVEADNVMLVAVEIAARRRRDGTRSLGSAHLAVL